MSTKILKSIKGKVVRLTRLDSCGQAVAGTCSTVVSECFIKVTISGEFEAGDEYTQKSAWGTLCINDKDPDVLKWVNVQIDFAELNADALDILTNADPVISGGNTIGSTWSAIPNDTAFALEVWTKRTGVDCVGANPDWGYFVVPFVKNGKLDGDIAIENAALTVSIMGNGFAAPYTWDDGPYTPKPWVGVYPTGAVWGQIVTSVQPPADTNGCVPLSPVS